MGHHTFEIIGYSAAVSLACLTVGVVYSAIASAAAGVLEVDSGSDVNAAGGVDLSSLMLVRPHPVPMASQARHNMCPNETISSRSVVPQERGNFSTVGLVSRALVVLHLSG